MAENVLPSTLSARQIVEAIPDGVLITDPAGVICYVNQGFCDVTGYRPEEVIGKNPRLLQSGRHPASFYRRIWRSVMDRGCWKGEICNRRKNGSLYIERLTILAIRDRAGRLTHYVGLFTDISSRKRAERNIKRRAFHDTLTGLPNRALFLQHLRKALARARRGRSGLAVFFIDLDHIKSVNDSLGHAAGDQLLRQAALRLAGTVRGEDTVSRFGGDEFVMLLTELKNRADVERAGEKVLNVLRSPFTIASRDLIISASMGAALYPDGGASAEALIVNADTALYRAKSQGRDRLEFFRPEHVDGPSPGAPD